MRLGQSYRGTAGSPEVEPRGTISENSSASSPFNDPPDEIDTSPSPLAASVPSPGSLQFASFNEMISGGSGSKVLGTASTGLEELKIILEAVDTLPFVKALASVGIQVLQYVIVGSAFNLLCMPLRCAMLISGV